MQKRLLFLFGMLFSLTITAMAQITTSGISGKVTSKQQLQLRTNLLEQFIGV